MVHCSAYFSSYHLSWTKDQKNFKKKISSGRGSFSFGSLLLNNLKHYFDSRHATRNCSTFLTQVS